MDVTHIENRRRRVSDPGQDQRLFSDTADMTHVENSRKNPMRGGYRL